MNYEVVVFGMDNTVDKDGNFKHFYTESTTHCHKQVMVTVPGAPGVIFRF
jgi:hypothetical protein